MVTPKQSLPIYLTTVEVARRFRMHPKSVNRWVAAKSEKYPRPLKVGNKLLWPIEQIERFERQSRLKPIANL